MQDLVNLADRGASTLIDKYVPGELKPAASKIKDIGKDLIDSSLTPSGDISSSMPSSDLSDPEPTQKLTGWRKFWKGAGNVLKNKTVGAITDAASMIPKAGGIINTVKNVSTGVADYFANKGPRGKKQKQYDAQFKKQHDAWVERQNAKYNPWEQ